MNPEDYKLLHAAYGILPEPNPIFAGEKIEVLDKGFVRLVEWMGSDLSIVRNARVSHDADWRAGADDEGDRKLINYLMAKKHTSPFEAVVFNFEVKLPIFIARQWHRHRTWAYNEISARYAKLDEGFYIPDVNKIGAQSKNNKQARDLNEECNDPWWAQRIIDLNCTETFMRYENLIENGVPRELARTVLPVNAYTRMFAKVDLHNLFGFLKDRLGEGAQYEIRMYARALFLIAQEVCPVACQAFLKHNEIKPL